MPILYSAIAYDQTIVSNFASCDGNFREITKEIITKIPGSDERMTYYHGPYLIHYKVEDSYLYLCITDKFCQRSRAFLFLNEIQRNFQEDTKKNYTEVLANEMYRYSEDYNNIVIRQGELDELNEIGVESSETILGEKLLLVNNPEQISYTTVTYVGKTPEKISISEFKSDEVDIKSNNKIINEVKSNEKDDIKPKISGKKLKTKKRKDSEKDVENSESTESKLDKKAKSIKNKNKSVNNKLVKDSNDSMKEENNIDINNKPAPNVITKNKENLEQESKSKEVPIIKNRNDTEKTTSSKTIKPDLTKPKQLIIKPHEIVDNTEDKPKISSSITFNSKDLKTIDVKESETLPLTKETSKFEKTQKAKVNEEKNAIDKEKMSFKQMKKHTTNSIPEVKERNEDKHSEIQDVTNINKTSLIDKSSSLPEAKLKEDFIDKDETNSYTKETQLISDEKWKKYINNIEIEPIVKCDSNSNLNTTEYDSNSNEHSATSKMKDGLNDKLETPIVKSDSNSNLNTTEYDSNSKEQLATNKISIENDKLETDNREANILQEKQQVKSDATEFNRNTEDKTDLKQEEKYMNHFIQNNGAPKIWNAQKSDEKSETPEELKMHRIRVFIGVFALIMSALYIFGPASSIVVLGVASVSYKKYLKNGLCKSD